MPFGNGYPTTARPLEKLRTPSQSQEGHFPSKRSLDRKWLKLLALTKVCSDLVNIRDVLWHLSNPGSELDIRWTFAFWTKMACTKIKPVVLPPRIRMNAKMTDYMHLLRSLQGIKTDRDGQTWTQRIDGVFARGFRLYWRVWKPVQTAGWAHRRAYCDGLLRFGHQSRRRLISRSGFILEQHLLHLSTLRQMPQTITNIPRFIRRFCHLFHSFSW